MKTRRNTNLKRIIVDYRKLNDNILNLLVNKYPDGYDDEDIITFKNANNEIVECVEVATEDTLYLIKVGKRLVTAMKDFDESEDNNSEKGQDLLDEPEMEEE
ncbi:hypothetical protein [Aquimarina mytili]|uniref:DNA primase n=1 Tax=Aquimarina mytili TaxID=874423 RepID=A0A936ZMH5_9FLAO|nr:hypothetical protein [Aquimarina mytili]MBL0682364.1 hypothetical protein [Aquimarina mytili]